MRYSELVTDFTKFLLGKRFNYESLSDYFNNDGLMIINLGGDSRALDEIINSFPNDYPIKVSSDVSEAISRNVLLYSGGVAYNERVRSFLPRVIDYELIIVRLEPGSDGYDFEALLLGLKGFVEANGFVTDLFYSSLGDKLVVSGFTAKSK